MHPGTVFCAPVLLAAALLPAQGPSGDPTLAPLGMRVVFVDVGQGDSTILVGPTGICVLVDAGRNGDGRSKVIPALRSLGVTRVDLAVVSHYHADHLGGMDEVLDNFPVTAVWDRGLGSAPSTISYKDYARSAASKRSTVVLGSSYQLGGGGRIRVLAANGSVVGGASYPISSGAQRENAASVVLRVDYGDFSMWLGGDCTGGGNSTYDIESKVASACGDVDLLHVNHHGSSTSTNATTLGLLKPEVCVASAGYRNAHGHPTGPVTNRINSASLSRLFLCTTSGANSYRGFARAGSIRLVTDGFRYRISDVLGSWYDIYTDEVRAATIGAGSLRISELHRSPSATYGAYLEIYCQGPHPVNLRGLRVLGTLGSFTVATPYRLLPGQHMLFQEHGDRDANGGQPFGHCWPYQALRLAAATDTLELRHNSTLVDRLSFNRNLAGGAGIAAERTILDAATAVTLFSAATKSFGNGDRGSPATNNAVDLTSYEPVASMEILPTSASGGAAIHLIAGAYDHRSQPHVMAMSLGSSPGMTLAGTHIPLNPDGLFEASLLLPGVFGSIPTDGRRGLRIPVPRVAGLQGLTAYFAHTILDPSGPRPFPAASNPIRFIFP